MGFRYGTKLEYNPAGPVVIVMVAAVAKVTVDHPKGSDKPETRDVTGTDLKLQQGFVEEVR